MEPARRRPPPALGVRRGAQAAGEHRQTDDDGADDQHREQPEDEDAVGEHEQPDDRGRPERAARGGRRRSGPRATGARAVARPEQGEQEGPDERAGSGADGEAGRSPAEPQGDPGPERRGGEDQADPQRAPRPQGEQQRGEHRRRAEPEAREGQRTEQRERRPVLLGQDEPDEHGGHGRDHRGGGQGEPDERRERVAQHPVAVVAGTPGHRAQHREAHQRRADRDVDRRLGQRRDGLVPGGRDDTHLRPRQPRSRQPRSRGRGDDDDVRDRDAREHELDRGDPAGLGPARAVGEHADHPREPRVVLSEGRLACAGRSEGRPRCWSPARPPRREQHHERAGAERPDGAGGTRAEQDGADAHAQAHRDLGHREQGVAPEP